jgi:hypothetical protein
MLRSQELQAVFGKFAGARAGEPDGVAPLSPRLVNCSRRAKHVPILCPVSNQGEAAHV